MFPDVDVLRAHGLHRCAKNPLITPNTVQPTCSSLSIVGTFNPGALILPTGQTILLVRVAEKYEVQSAATVSVPVASPTVVNHLSASSCSATLSRIDLARSNSSFDFDSDARVVLSASVNGTPQVVKYLTSISHLRCARSDDGIHFETDTCPFLFPGVAVQREDSSMEPWLRSMLMLESWGVEDPRIVDMTSLPGGVLSAIPGEFRRRLPPLPSGAVAWSYLVTYTAVSRFGAATSMAAITNDFSCASRLGVIFAPENKDVCIFPAICSGSQGWRFFCYHRPVPKSFGNPDIWSASSSDLVSWGDHRHILGTTDGDTLRWDAGRVGGGAPSVLTSFGWLHVYHAADKSHRYCLGVFLAAKEDPTIVVAQTTVPILTPEESYEQKGFFPNVVFTCGVVLKKPSVEMPLDTLWIYYGAADERVALCVFSLDYIFKLLGVN